MAYKQLLYINGYEVPNIISYEDLLSEQDGENSGRTPNLNMNRDILGRIANISVKLGPTEGSVIRKILAILKKNDITVKFLNSEINDYSIISCYCIDPKKEKLATMGDYYKSLDFTLVSNGRVD